MQLLSCCFRLIDTYQLVVPTYLTEDVKILRDTEELKAKPKEKRAIFYLKIPFIFRTHVGMNERKTFWYELVFAFQQRQRQFFSAQYPNRL
jgi:hypothetical protein